MHFIVFHEVTIWRPAYDFDFSFKLKRVLIFFSQRLQSGLQLNSSLLDQPPALTDRDTCLFGGNKSHFVCHSIAQLVKVRCPQMSQTDVMLSGSYIHTRTIYIDALIPCSSVELNHQSDVDLQMAEPTPTPIGVQSC